MGLIGDSLGVVKDKLTSNGSAKTTGIKDFLNHFSATGGEWIKSIDPLNTFEIKFRFHPNANDVNKGEKTGFLGKLGNAAVSAAKNIANNLTGGLAGNLFNELNGNVKDALKDKKDTDISFARELFINQLLTFDDENFLELYLSQYVQDVTIPAMEMNSNNEVTNQIGTFPVNGNIVKPNTHNLTMNIINTKLPLIDRIFYPWMREVVLPQWTYPSQPYTTADITVDFRKHNSIRYVFYGCRPAMMNMLQASQQNSGNITRMVTFIFDYMCVKDKKLYNMETVGQKLMNTGAALLGGGSKMLGF